ncbi:unnamed protein product [Lymnaea stagnalis]|uniref:Uncharacterized protein n=1 Tax=Lymnaea stagnalis TaxID=6523 RepID=A0AAV2ILF4_LYMST
MKFPKLVFGVIVLKFVSIVVGIDVANFDFNYDIIGEELPGRARVKDGSVQDVDGTEESRERTDGATDKTGPQKRPWAEQEQVSPEEIFIMFTKAPMYARRNFLQSSEVSKNRLPGKDQGKKSYVEKRPREEINKMFHKGVSNTSEGLREKGGFVELSRHKNGEPIVVSPDETENAKASSKEAISKEYIPFVDASSKETGGSSLIEDSGEIEAAMQGAPLAYIRVVRQAKTVEKIVCNGGDFSGDIIIGVDFIINKKLSNNEYTEGVLENQQLKMDIDHALKTVMEPFINKDFTGVNFTLDVNVTSIRADGHVLVDIAVADNLTGNCMSGKVDTEVRKSLANALIDMDRYQRLKIGAEVYDISDPLMEPNKPPLNQLIPAVCVTCDSHHNCTKRPSNEWYCR